MHIKTSVTPVQNVFGGKKKSQWDHTDYNDYYFKKWEIKSVGKDV